MKRALLSLATTTLTTNPTAIFSLTWLAATLLTTTVVAAAAFAAITTNNNNGPQQGQQQQESSTSFPSSSLTLQVCDNIPMKNFRSVRKVLPRTSPHWVGDGFLVYPVFANAAFTEHVSPLLMFDYAEPMFFPAKTLGGGAPLGVGKHPHRGFETVTVAFQGQVEHQDSMGHRDVIGQGDVQWMTAGRGIIHSEYHSQEFTKTGGMFEFCQLWVNLPKKYKMTKPKYQAILKKDIPVVNLPVNNNSDDSNDDSSLGGLLLGTARIIAGQLGETRGAASTFSPVQMWDVTLFKKDSVVDLPFPANHNGMVFVRRGAVQIVSGSSSDQGDGNKDDDDDDDRQLTTRNLGPQDVALLRMDDESDMIRLKVLEDNSAVLILGGEPLDEPIAAQGPFVMNTMDEIRQAISDYRLGKLGN